MNNDNNRQSSSFSPDADTPKGFAADLKSRLSKVKPTRWVRFGIVTLLLLLFVIWLGNPWVFLVWLLLADIYITQYIPWSWWKDKKGPTRTFMAWVDAIVYALVLVYIIFAFIGQNYTIPSSSLEKSLLVGDYLWVNKTVYGPRVPNTPLHFPLAHHTMPLIGGKSYIDNPQLPYHRLPGLRGVEHGDIVVFNFPEGDTVLANYPQQDYYIILNELAKSGIEDPRAYIAARPAQFGEIIVRPVDRRENYVKRAIGMPGDRLQLRHDTVFINGKAMPFAESVQFNYIIPVKGTIDLEKWQSIGVRAEDHGTAPIDDPRVAPWKFYSVPLTAEMKKVVESWPEVAGPLVKENLSGFYDTGNVWPLGNRWGWTRSDTDEFWIPKRGTTLHLTLENLPLYRRAITAYEGNTLEVKEDGTIVINGKPTEYYTFKYDYYWMMGDNRDRSLDSRYFGLVPEDHIVGQPMMVLVSFDQEKGLFDGKIRFDRILKNANPDKDRINAGL